jgi:DNA polymerase III delta prime subunit
MIWIDKYKPLNIKDYEHCESIKNLLINIIKKQYVPNLLLYGPSGSGKSSAANIISRNVTDFNSILYINASDEKGIKTIRERIKTFINIKSSNIKIIILDEADELSDESQLALRKIIEIKTVNIRFIIICNYINNIINTLRSRFLNIKLNRLKF